MKHISLSGLNNLNDLNGSAVIDLDVTRYNEEPAAPGINIQDVPACTPGLGNEDGADGGDGGGNFWNIFQEALPFAMDAIKKLGQGADRNGVSQLLQKIINDNSLWLYPRAEHGGPWPKKGAGNMDTMTEDELRYFIEWRLPLYLKFISDINNFETGTKKRVQNRYIAATKGLIEVGKEKFKQRYGCYVNSGLYSGVGQSGSSQIKHFDQNCATPGAPKTAGIGGNISTMVLLLGGAAAAITIAKKYKGSKSNSKPKPKPKLSGVQTPKKVLV